MPNPADVLSFALIDRSGEIGRFGLNVALPADAEELTTSTIITNFRDALTAVTAGVLKTVQFSEVRKISNAEQGEGQREDKALVMYEDTVSLEKYTVEIPTVDQVTILGRDLYDITTAPWSTFVTAFEALAVSPDGNPVNVLSISRVGRNI